MFAVFAVSENLQKTLVGLCVAMRRYAVFFAIFTPVYVEMDPTSMDSYVRSRLQRKTLICDDMSKISHCMGSKTLGSLPP